MNFLSRNPRRSSKWMLFAAFLLTVPVPFFMIIVGGLVPTAWILYFAVHGLFVAVPKFTAEGFWILGILWAHVVILGGLLYVAATGITWILFLVLPARFARLGVLALIIALFVASTFEIYRVPGHNSSPPANILRIMKTLAT
ncbi:MAG: hypothetical protein ACE5K9_05140 [Candidatus Methylomirabilales bacterium]